MGFIPNEVARSLFKKSDKIIGLILPVIENPFFTQFASAMEKKADESGYRLLLCNTNGNLGKEKSALSMLASMNVTLITIDNAE